MLCLGQNGAYIEDLQVIPKPQETTYPWARGDVEAKKCWAFSEKMVGQTFA